MNVTVNVLDGIEVTPVLLTRRSDTFLCWVKFAVRAALN